MSAIGAAKDNIRVDVLYGSKLPQGGVIQQILFLERIAKLFSEGALKGKLLLRVTGTGQRPTNLEQSLLLKGVTGVRFGRPTADEVTDLLAEGEVGTTAVYICGPPQMTDFLAEVLVRRQAVSEDLVLTEKWW